MKRGFRVLVAVVMAGLVGSFVSPAGAAEQAVDITANRTVVVAGSGVNLTFSTSGDEAQTSVRIVYTYANGVVKEGTLDVNDGDPYQALTYPPINLRVDAYANGTLSDSLSIKVRSRVDTGPRGGFLGYSGSYAVFPKGSSPRFRATDLPGRAGRCMRHVVQRKYAAGWRTVFTSACRAESGGKVDWTWRGKHASGVRFRVRATFAGDSWNLANTSAYRYFRFR